MAQYEVVVRGEGREVYIVEADGPEEAAANWMNGWLELSEVSGVEVYSVTEDR